MLWPLDEAAERAALVPRLHPDAAGRAQRLLRVPHRAARAAVPRGAAPPEGVRRSSGATPAMPADADAAFAAGARGGHAAARRRRSRCRSRPATAPSTASTRRATSGTGAATSSQRSPTTRSRCTSSSRGELPTWHSTMHLYPSDGAAARVAPTRRRGRYRDAQVDEVIVGVDPDPANAEADQGLDDRVLGRAAPVLDGRRRT